MRRQLLIRSVVAIALFGAVTLGGVPGVIDFAAPVGASVSFTVDSNGTEVDLDPGNGTCATASGTCTLRAALQEAAATTGSDVTISIPVGNYTLTDRTNLTTNVTIAGANAAETTIDLATSGGFDISESDLVLADLTLTSGQTGEDGGVVRGIKSNITLTDVAALNNTAETSGGVIRLDQGVLRVKDSEFEGNSSQLGGAIAVMNASLEVTNSTFTNNAASTAGGAIWANHPTGFSIDDSTFRDNTTLGQGGGVYVDGFDRATGQPVVDGSEFVGNSAGGEGGAIFIGSTASRGSLPIEFLITNSEIKNNIGLVGGGVALDFGTLSLDDSEVSGNQAVGGGGGGVASGGVIEITNATITNNTATDSGGGVISNGPISISGSDISHNTAGELGGGLAALGLDTPVLRNTSITNNTADVTGGGLWRLGNDLDESGMTYNNNAPNDALVAAATTAEDAPSEDGGTPTPGTTPGQTPGPSPDGGSGASEGNGESAGGADEDAGGSPASNLAWTGAQILLVTLFGVAFVAAGIYMVRRGSVETAEE